MIRWVLSRLIGPESVYPAAALASITAAMTEVLAHERAS